jgi:hypothetical protein
MAAMRDWLGRNEDRLHLAAWTFAAILAFVGVVINGA